MSRPREFDVAVVGGGVAGLCAAALFAEPGARVAAIAPDLNDAFPHAAIEARNYAISPASAGVLRAAGAWALLDHTRCGVFDAIEVWDAGSAGTLSFAPPPAHHGAMGWIIEHQNLVAALSASAVKREVSLFSAGLRSLACGRPSRLVLSDGETLDARLTIAADGANSRVRSAAGLTVNRRAYRQRALVANVVTERTHQHVARQRFLATGPLAFLPLADAHQSSIVWSCDEDLADELQPLGAAAFAERLGAAFEQRLGRIVTVDERVWFDLECARADRWFNDTCVLVGDAAHVVHPLAGQGLNLGLMDVAALCECLADGREQPGWPRRRQLRHYERWRKSEAQTLRLVTDTLQRLFARNERLVRAMRGRGMQLTDRLTPLKHRIIRHAMDSGSVIPRLAARAIGGSFSSTA